jgi:hypothetical protein
MPWVDLYWSMTYTLSNDQTSGQILFSNPTSNFDQQPVVESQSESFWQELLNDLSGVITDQTIPSLVSGVQTFVEGSFSTSFQSSMAGLSLFVLPGSGIFNFSNVYLNGAYALTTDIAYVAPQ